MSNKESNIEKTNFDAFIQAVGSEIEQAQVRLIVAANAQMLFHYWKIGNYILYHQQLHGWGSKIIKQLAKAIRLHYPEKKGYSERNLTYMCQFAKAYPLRALQSFIETDASLSVPTIQSVTNEVLKLNDKQFTQELTAQIQSIDCQSLAITQEVPAQFEDVGKTVSAIYRMGIREIEEVFLTSPIAKINWTSQMTILDSSLPLGLSYWYMKQSVEMGWSSNVLKMQIDSDLYSRQISNNKVNNFTTTLPAPQSDLANYLLKDPYIFDLVGAKEKADERDIEEQLVKHVTERDFDWSDTGIEGASRFLNRIWRLYADTCEVLSPVGACSSTAADAPTAAAKEVRLKEHLTVKKAGEDIGNRYQFNTAIAAIMELVNALYLAKDELATTEEGRKVLSSAMATVLTLLAPITPHVCEELWEDLGHARSIDQEPWPVWKEDALQRDVLTVVIQINDKLRGKIEVPASASKEEVEQLALTEQNIVRHLEGLTVRKVVVIPGKLVNVVAN